MKIAICICTYRRPAGLSRLLHKLQQLETDDELVIVVADNDNERQEGARVALAMQSSRWPIIAQPVVEQGISYSRNMAARLALAEKPEFIAFIDDDEWPEPHWLNALVHVQQTCDADVVGGPTLPAFPDHVDERTRSNQYFGADLGLADGSVCQLEAAGNFLIRADTLRPLGPLFFHPDFARSGGEDLAFFLRLQQNSARMHWAANATVWETVSEERLSLAWMNRRVMLIANSRVHVMSMLQPGLSASLVRYAKTATLFTLAVLLSILGLIHTASAEKARLLRWKFWGKITAHLRIRSKRIEGR